MDKKRNDTPSSSTRKKIPGTPHPKSSRIPARSKSSGIPARPKSSGIARPVSGAQKSSSSDGSSTSPRVPGSRIPVLVDRPSGVSWPLSNLAQRERLQAEIDKLKNRLKERGADGPSTVAGGPSITNKVHEALRSENERLREQLMEAQEENTALMEEKWRLEEEIDKRGGEQGENEPPDVQQLRKEVVETHAALVQAEKTSHSAETLIDQLNEHVQMSLDEIAALREEKAQFEQEVRRLQDERDEYKESVNNALTHAQTARKQKETAETIASLKEKELKMIQDRLTSVKDLGKNTEKLSKDLQEARDDREMSEQRALKLEKEIEQMKLGMAQMGQDHGVELQQVRGRQEAAERWAHHLEDQDKHKSEELRQTQERLRQAEEQAGMLGREREKRTQAETELRIAREQLDRKLDDEKRAVADREEQQAQLVSAIQHSEFLTEQNRILHEEMAVLYADLTALRTRINSSWLLRLLIRL